MSSNREGNREWFFIQDLCEFCSHVAEYHVIEHGDYGIDDMWVCIEHQYTAFS